MLESEAGIHGLMGLSDVAISEAAGHLRLSPDLIATDVRANVRAAAWIVADRRAQGLNWNAAALATTGITDAALRSRWVLRFNRIFEASGTTPEQLGEPSIAPEASTAAADYGPASFVPASSSNYTSANRTHADLYYVVIHDIEGSYDSAISWFQNPASQVSAHFVTSNAGDITQMVRISDIAWHAGNWDYNQHSVGIEHEGYAADPNSYPETMYQSSAALTRWLSDTYIISLDRTHVLGHVEVPGSTHHDPGPYWNWDHYMELVNAGGAVVQAKLVGYVRIGDTLDVGTYTITATAPGYNQAVDTKTVDSATTYWKSLALEATDPGTGGNPGNAAAGAGHKSGCDVGEFDGSNWAGSLLALGALALLLRRRTA